MVSRGAHRGVREAGDAADVAGSSRIARIVETAAEAAGCPCLVARRRGLLTALIQDRPVLGGLRLGLGRGGGGDESGRAGEHGDGREADAPRGRRCEHPG